MSLSIDDDGLDEDGSYTYTVRDESQEIQNGIPIQSLTIRFDDPTSWDAEEKAWGLRIFESILSIAISSNVGLKTLTVDSAGVCLSFFELASTGDDEHTNSANAPGLYLPAFLNLEDIKLTLLSFEAEDDGDHKRITQMGQALTTARNLRKLHLAFAWPSVPCDLDFEDSDMLINPSFDCIALQTT